MGEMSSILIMLKTEYSLLIIFVLCLPHNIKAQYDSLSTYAEEITQVVYWLN